MEVLELTPDWEDGYERFVADHPNTLLYYSLRFRDFLVDLLGCTPRYAVAVHGGHVAGVFPTMVTEGRYGRVLNSLPYYGSNGGALTTSATAGHALVQWYRAEVNEDEMAAATVVANPLDADPFPPPHDLVDERIGHVTVFPGGAMTADDQVWLAIDSSARRNVKKAAQHAVEVNVENENLADLETLHRESMEVAGGQAKTRAFFDAVPAHFRPGTDYNLYVARIGDEPAAAVLLFYYGSTAEYYVPALRPSFRPAQPMAALLHRAMTDAVTNGFRRWNWGGSWPTHESLMRFKSKWGGQGRVYQYWTKLNRPELRSSTAGALLAAYPGFFVLPFSALHGLEGHTTA
ncbi:MAG TPA: GNAT family N-acetyltransferase [Acidimicrobiales bacterium]|nr:GNAT family N-acetyltransferase [Acidimicrobiales bacterium]